MASPGDVEAEGGSERVLVPTPGLGINKSIIEEHERLVRQLFSPLTMGELRKPLARLSPDTARSVQPKPPQVLPA